MEGVSHHFIVALELYHQVIRTFFRKSDKETFGTLNIICGNEERIGVAGDLDNVVAAAQLFALLEVHNSVLVEGLRLPDEHFRLPARSLARRQRRRTGRVLVTEVGLTQVAPLALPRLAPVRVLANVAQNALPLPVLDLPLANAVV